MTAEAAALRVLIVDDHDIVRAGLRSMLESGGVTVVGEATTSRDAVDMALALLPDVVVMDVRLAGGSGIEATREIRSRTPQVRVLILTSFPDDQAVLASVLAGASGYFLKGVRCGELVRAVHSVAAGDDLIDGPAAAAAQDRLRRGKHLGGDDRLARLSGQEERVLELVADGFTNVEIGARLGLAEKTVKNYMSSILVKLEVGRRAEAAAYLAGHARSA